MTGNSDQFLMLAGGALLIAGGVFQSKKLRSLLKNHGKTTGKIVNADVRKKPHGETFQYDVEMIVKFETEDKRSHEFKVRKKNLTKEPTRNEINRFLKKEYIIHYDKTNSDNYTTSIAKNLFISGFFALGGVALIIGTLLYWKQISAN